MAAAVGDIIRVKAHDFTAEGKAVARYGEAVVFISGALPGEIVDAKITAQKKNFWEGITVAVSERSPSRIEANCRCFGSCGGCELLFCRYEEQLSIKASIIRRAFLRMGHIDVGEVEMIASPRQTAFRNKALYHVKNGQIGFFAKRSNELCEVSTCLLQPEISNTALSVIRRWLAGGDGAGLVSVMLRTADDGKLQIALVSDEKISGVKKLLNELLSSGIALHSLLRARSAPNEGPGKIAEIFYGGDIIEMSLFGVRFQISPSSFFQTNLEVSEQLFSAAFSVCSVAGKNVLDPYCGTGVIALIAARSGAKRAVGVDISVSAVKNAAAVAQANGIFNCEFICAPAEKVLSDRDFLQTNNFECVFLDPPRKGCDPKTISTLISSGVNDIVYISCNPATLARDARLFLDAGYRIVSLKGADMFPQTCSIETVCLLSKL